MGVSLQSVPKRSQQTTMKIRLRIFVFFVLLVSISEINGGKSGKTKGTISKIAGKVKDKVLGRETATSSSSSKGSFKDKAIDKIADKIAGQIKKKIPGSSGSRPKGDSGSGKTKGSSGSSGSRPKGDPGQMIGKIMGGYPGSSGSKSKGSKSKVKSTLKKAAVIGVGAYGAYKLGKLTSKYSSWSWGRQNGYSLDDWDDWREVDGLLCRNSLDCEWIDPNLYCQDYELRFTPNRAWFGGDVASISGECACPPGMFWDESNVKCQRPRNAYNFAEKTARPDAVLIAYGICFLLRQILFNA